MNFNLIEIHWLTLKIPNYFLFQSQHSLKNQTNFNFTTKIYLSSFVLVSLLFALALDLLYFCQRFQTIVYKLIDHFSYF